MAYNIKSQEFEGPLDLLLDLIEAHKFSISNISLAKIADEYVNHIKSLENFPREEVADFLVIASTLVLIKSRSLLPQLEISEEEKESIYDLEARLKILKRIRDLSEHIKSGWRKKIMFERESLAGHVFGFISPEGINTVSLHDAMSNLVAAFPRKDVLPKVVLEKVMSIEEKMIELVGRVSRELKATFHDLVGSKNRGDVIVGFLALLELIKQGAFLVKQEEVFGKIELEHANNGNKS